MRRTIIAVSLLLSNLAGAQDLTNDELTGAPYTAVRENLRRAGFTPLIDGYACQGTDRRCDRFPEYGFCDPQPPGLCIGRWQFPDRRGFVSVSTIGFSSPVVYIISQKR